MINIITNNNKPQDVGKTYLIHTEYLDKVNHSTIFQLLDKSMHILWPNNVNHEEILLFVSDPAPYMKKGLIPNWFPSSKPTHRIGSRLKKLIY
jgi:hypothetical protein